MRFARCRRLPGVKRHERAAELVGLGEQLLESLLDVFADSIYQKLSAPRLSVGRRSYIGTR
jgi:hypothetical protein